MATAEKYVKDHNFFWNAGIFIMSAATIVNAFRVYQPGIAKIFESMRSIYGTEKEQEQIDLRYPECENISIDYAIMEKQKKFSYSLLISDGVTWEHGVACWFNRKRCKRKCNHRKQYSDDRLQE